MQYGDDKIFFFDGGVLSIEGGKSPEIFSKEYGDQHICEIGGNSLRISSLRK